MSPRREEPCYWCGGPSTGRDHVFPESLFLPPRPALITVPACDKHNRDLQQDEQYFRAFVVTRAYPKETAKRLWEGPLRRQLRAAPKFRSRLAAQVRSVDFYSPGGIYLGKTEALVAEPNRINRVLEKIVRGLYLHEQAVILGDVEFSFHFISPLTVAKVPEEASDLIKAMPPPRKLGDAVMYRFGTAPEDERVSMWVLQFFERSLFIVATVPPGLRERNALATYVVTPMPQAS